MSKITIVEGKLTKTATGNIEIRATEGDLTIAAAKHNIQYGKEGMNYHDYEPLHPDDSLSNEKTVRLNLFFDGTQNNKTNTEAGKEHENSNHLDDSYTNDYSNVARGYDAVDPNAENQIRIYIEGIGTEDLESETIFFGNMPDNSGIPMGEGERGVKAKVTKACFLAGEKLQKYAKKVTTLEVNVYGFSRGATAARHFLHVANTPTTSNTPMLSSETTVMPPYGLRGATYTKTEKNDALVQQHGFFGACLAAQEFVPDEIIFRFVGLYDTVAAYGVNHRGVSVFGIDIIDNDTKQLGLDAVKKASFVLQFAADDEHRDNFDLTNIDSAGINGIEITLPGVHSDIGGCYVENDSETVDLFYERYFNRECEKFKQILIEEGWYNPDQLHIIHSYTTDFTQAVPKEYDDNPAGYYGLVGIKKAIHNSYDKVALNQMFHYSKQFDVIYKTLNVNDHKIQDPFLIDVNKQLVHYINTCTRLRNQYFKSFKEGENIVKEYLAEVKKIRYQDFIDLKDLKKLRREYLHWSASATKFGLGPRLGGIKIATQRTRNIQNG
ncbi:DUF2235 domain-containing protein [Flavobacterium crocinum]|uniref:DUF2235 domain-containing protein n=1 Tax=Flavobacterium crocinum TaxID=2183896 RepID=A0A2S1YM92_9FLAO|nr:DUF2235 domain-containing protein [Flavobacterium crocinum]AWK05204.1 DUF2235 domain-containing protein [Flavobacterium crocinum]